MPFMPFILRLVAIALMTIPALPWTDANTWLLIALGLIGLAIYMIAAFSYPIGNPRYIVLRSSIVCQMECYRFQFRWLAALVCWWHNMLETGHTAQFYVELAKRDE